MRYRLWRSGKMIDISREKKLGEGGEAGVFCVSAMKMAAKIYHHPDQRYAAKLKVMLENPPADPASEPGHVSIAWPCDLLLHQGDFHGYIMPLVEGMQPLVNFYVPKLRREKRPLFDYYYLVTTALNVATAVRALHDRNYVIGDVNESNILVSDRALATVVDTDSFQVADAGSGTIYRCLVGKPEFTPPELQLPGTNFAHVNREREHDCFGLAVVLFQLLMEGTHPFDGVYAGRSEPPSVDERIAAGHFPHAGTAGGPNRPKPIAPAFGMLEPGLQRLFVQCFVEGHRSPSARPNAAAWRAALERARELMRFCPVNDRHRHWGHVACPWCERKERLRGVDPFPSLQDVKQGRHLLQKSHGAQTPQPPPPPRPRPIPFRPAPGRTPVRPTQPRGVHTPARPGARPVTRRKPPAPKTPQGIITIVMIFAFFVLRLIVGTATPSRSYPVSYATPRASYPSYPSRFPSTLDVNTKFLDTPLAGRNFTTQRIGGMRMVWISPGNFQMGDLTGNGSPDEKPVHIVSLDSGYWVGETLVTQAQWTAVMGTFPSKFKGAYAPVEMVSWNEAMAFCQKLTEQERAKGHLLPGMYYRLPTEAQWEFACRAGTKGNYAGNLDAMGWYDLNSGERTHEVKMKLPNAWGLYDMHGNVWEWCSDRYGPYSSEARDEPLGPFTGENRVLRGGSWFRAATFCRSSARSSMPPSQAFDNVGFRVAAVLTGPKVPINSDVSSWLKQHPIPVVKGEPRTEVVTVVTGVTAGEERTFEIADNAHVRMCWIPAGNFTMGSPPKEAGRFPNEAQTKVRLSRGFWLAKTVCTQQVWRAVMGTNPSNFKNDDNLPVEQVSWNDCQSFTLKLRQQEGGWRYALPTEAQWEYACRAGTTGAYAGVLDFMAWYGANSGNTTHPVGTKLANAWGLQDMHGNVWEWCRDAYTDNPPGGADPEVKNGDYRVLRGGSWLHADRYCRSAFRRKYKSEDSYYFLGFRLALIPPNAPQ